ncbi:MAG: tol-pal system YbgF family protein [Saprospiraceae bacterium]
MSLDKKIEADLKNTFGDEGAAQLRDTLKNVDAKWTAPASEETVVAPRQAKVRRLSIGRMMSIAATLLLLAVAGWWVLDDGSSSDPNDLYAEYASPYRVTMVTRDASEGILIQLAQTAYQEEDYGTAYASFSKLSEQEPTATQFQFYAGVSALLDGNAAEAIPIFEGLLAQEDHLFVEQSRWYLALANLQEGDSASAKTYLQDIEEGAYKSEEAKALLSQLKK